MASRRSRRLTALILILAVVAALVTRVPDERDASAFDFNFVDIPAGSYYEVAVYWMVQEQITFGTSSSTYSPANPVTREQMAAFLYRFAGGPGNYPNHPFTDVLSTDWSNKAVEWLLHFEITTGTSPTTFSPHAPVTRAQMAAFLYRLAGSPAIDEPNPFSDVPPGTFYHDAVVWMHSVGVTTGTSPTTYSPDDVVTRAQIAALLWRFAGKPVPGGFPTTTTTSATSSTTTTTTTTIYEPAHQPATTTTLPPAGDYVRIVSIPDFFNVDVGTIGGVFDLGSDEIGDSRTEELDRSIWYILESIKADNPDFVLVAGDLVMGHWYADAFEREVFGSTATTAGTAAAIDRAGDVYYSQWLDRFEQRGLDVYPAVGDHELGDNPWPVFGDGKSPHVDTYRAEFAQHFTQNPDGSSRYDGTVTSDNVPARPPTSQWSDTAYAFEYEDAGVKVLVITLDVFYQANPAGTQLIGDEGTVAVTLRDVQLDWLDDVLTGADNDETIDHVLVQGHTPTLVPVRWRSTSQLYLRDDNGGSNTNFWQTLEAHDVPVYLTGEVHDITHSHSGGVHQVVHGGIIGSLSPVNYLVIDVYEDRIDMQVKDLPVQNTGVRMWQTRGVTSREITIWDMNWQIGFLTTGTLELTKKGNGTYSMAEETGKLLCYGICQN